jgi:hypothetical protein
MIRMLRAASMAAIVAGSLLLAGASTTFATAVDPGTLAPPPPPGARCFTTGPGRVTCDTVLNATLENVPDLEIPCGLLYVSGTDFRDGFRFYENGLMVRRHVTFTFNGTWSLSPTGQGPSVGLIARGGWWDVWPVPGGSDEDAVQISASGLDVKAIGPGLNAQFQIAGRFDENGDHTGIFTAFSDESLAALCDALGG